MDGQPALPLELLLYKLVDVRLYLGVGSEHDRRHMNERTMLLERLMKPLSSDRVRE
jgi:hypothetical protein